MPMVMIASPAMLRLERAPVVLACGLNALDIDQQATISTLSNLKSQIIFDEPLICGVEALQVMFMGESSLSSFPNPSRLIERRLYATNVMYVRGSCAEKVCICGDVRVFITFEFSVASSTRAVLDLTQMHRQSHTLHSVVHGIDDGCSQTHLLEHNGSMSIPIAREQPTGLVLDEAHETLYETG